MGIQLWMGRAIPLLWLASSLSLPTAPAAWAQDDLGDRFIAEAQAAGVPAGALARLSGGRVVEVRTYGGIEASSRFLWGSLSKPVAATVARTMAAEGLLDLSAPISRYVQGGPHVAVGHLADHTAGIPFGERYLDVDRPSASASAVAATLPTDAADVGAYRYSSLGFVYLQATIEAAAGTGYEAAIHETLTGTRLGASDSSCADVVAPHRFVGPRAITFPRRYDGAGAGYAYTCGSIRDLAKFAVQHLADPDVGTPVETGHPGQQYGAGWRITHETDGRVTHWHTGTVPGYFSALYLDPETGDGIGILLNASGYFHEEQFATITRNAYDRATHRTPAPLPSTNGALIPLGMVAAAVVLAVAARRTHPGKGWPRAAWTTGTFLAAGAVTALITLAGLPLRYYWLWEPGLVIGATILLLTCLAGTRYAWRRPS